jgi:hypothetical protein
VSVLNCPSNLNPIRLSDLSGGAALSNYAGCHHQSSAAIDSDNHGLLFLNSRIRRRDIRDGSSVTIALGEILRSDDDLGWASGTRATLRNTGWPINGLPPGTRTVELEPAVNLGSQTSRQYDWRDQNRDKAATVVRNRQPAPPPLPWNFLMEPGGFGSHHAAGAQFLMADGQARFVSSMISQVIYQRLGDRRDGILLGPDQF